MNILGLLGKNISYSFSQPYFKEKFQTKNIKNVEYRVFDIKHAEDIPQLFNTKNLVGFNVTIPYKEVILQHLDELSEEAEKIGAVNTVLLKNGQKIGFNTDVLGFIDSIKPLLKPNQKKALILGTGGSAKAIKVGFANLNIESKYVSRTNQNNGFRYEELTEEIINTHQIIVNCTPLGTFPNTKTFPNIPYQWLSAAHLLYDLTYNPEETAFLKRGKQQLATIKNGYEMLQKQADFAWEIWKKEILL